MAEVGLAYVTVAPSFRGFDRKMSSQVGKSSNSAGASSGKRFSAGFGKTFAAVGATLAVGSIIKSSIQLEASFSKTMNLVAASTGAPASAIAGLNKLALKLGAATQFSANDAAGAMLELAKAGISTSDIMGGALKGTLLLAAAGGTDLGTAATIASNAMNTFNLRGKDMNTIAAALAGGANASSASVESLGMALAQVGPGARNAGLSLQQTVGVLSAFDAAGIKGSDSGTSLKTMLSRLVPQTKKASDAMKKYNLSFVDSKGNFDSITTVAEKLQKKLGPLSEAQRATALNTIFGSDATRAATVLMNQGAAGIGKYIKATKDQGAAQRLADASMKGTAGAIERLKGSVETAELALGKTLAPTVQKVANFLSTSAVPAAQKFITQMQTGTGAGGEFADAIGRVVSVGKGIVNFFTSLPGPVKKFGAEIAIAAVAVNKMNTVFGGSAFAGAGGGSFLAGLGKAETRMGSFQKAAFGAGGAIRSLVTATGITILANSTAKAGDKMNALNTAAGGALTGAGIGAFVGPEGAAIGAAIGGLAGGLVALKHNLDSAGASAKVSVGSYKELTAAIDPLTGKLTSAARATEFQRLSQSGLLKTAHEVGLTDRQTIDAVVKGGKARESANRVLKSQLDLNKGILAQQIAATKVGSADQRLAAEAQVKKTKAIVAGIQALLRELGAGEKATKSWLEQDAAARKFSGAVKSLPKAVQMQLKLNGLERTDAGITKLVAKTGDLSRKDIAILIKENGGVPTAKRIDAIIAAARVLGGLRPTPRLGLGNFKGTMGNIAAVNAALDRAAHDRTAIIHVRKQVGVGATASGGLGLGADGQGATGGAMRRGQTFLVGEKGPELFTAGASGFITPNNRISGGSGSALGGDGSAVFHIYDVDDNLLGSMSGVADERYYAQQALPG